MATKFVQRLHVPLKNDKNYLRFDKGGYNYCIETSNGGGDVLPNCVGYAWGRWRELLGKFHELSRGNAEVWWGKQDGYERSQTPKLGSIICWRQGVAGNHNDGAGHVAVVEDVYPDGTILTSNSAWQGSRFYMREIKPPYSMGGNYVFQGFIHPPVEFSHPTLSKKSNEEVANEVLAGKWGNGAERKAKLTASGYNYSVIQDLVNKLVNKPQPSTPKKSNDEVAKEVLAGKWGNGQNRRDSLEKAGYNYSTIQALVNKLLLTNKPSLDTLANEVLAGKWGNGAERKAKLTNAGHNYYSVQAKVEEKLNARNKQTIDAVARKVINGDYGNGAARVNKLQAEGYDPVQVQRRVNELLRK